MSKLFRFEDPKDNTFLEVQIPEVLDANYGMYVWPCAPVLGQYIWMNRDFMTGKSVLELGAGTALPGIVAAKVGAGKVILSDAAQLPQCVENCSKSAKANGLEKEITIARISWGEFGPDLLNLEPVDIILGSDCYYDTKDFEDLVVTVAFLLEKNPEAQFWTTYQERSSERSIHALMMKWGLEGKRIRLDTFDADGASVAGSDLPGHHEIHMYVITRCEGKIE